MVGSPNVAATGGAGLAVLSTTESAGVDEPKPFAVPIHLT